jgi:hypothetical protein
MGDKSPKKQNVKKPSKSLKEKRAEKQSKREDKRPGFGHWATYASLTSGPHGVGAARLNLGTRATPENNHNDPTGHDDDPNHHNDCPNHHDDASPNRADDNADNCADQYDPGHCTSNHFDFDWAANVTDCSTDDASAHLDLAPDHEHDYPSSPHPQGRGPTQQLRPGGNRHL